jgi:hypothetical protein
MRPLHPRSAHARSEGAAGVHRRAIGAGGAPASVRSSSAAGATEFHASGHCGRHAAPPAATPALAQSSERRRVHASDARSGRVAAVCPAPKRALATVGKEEYPALASSDDARPGSTSCLDSDATTSARNRSATSAQPGLWPHHRRSRRALRRTARVAGVALAARAPRRGRDGGRSPRPRRASLGRARARDGGVPAGREMFGVITVSKPTVCATRGARPIVPA